MSNIPEKLFRALADGQFRSGAELAAAMGVTRSAIWKSVAKLRQLGAEVHAVPNRGYRLRHAVAPLDAARISALLPAMMLQRLDSLETQWQLESTNATLLAGPAPLPGQYAVLLAENQSGGRGRRGRNWLAPLGGSICYSVACALPQLPRDASALSLVIGVATLRALRAQGARELGLKWPNDVVAPGGKLAGVLIELRGESAGPVQLVVGVGINVRLAAATLREVRGSGTEPIDLAAVGATLDRNAIVGTMIGEHIACIDTFVATGFQPFLDEWRAADVLCDRPVTVHDGGEPWNGVARGIDDSGALRVARSDRTVLVTAGDVSIRAQP